MEPPREMGVAEAVNRVTEAPCSAAEAAVTKPAMPPPMTMTSSSIVSAIFSAGMGSGAISNAQRGSPLAMSMT